MRAIPAEAAQQRRRQRVLVERGEDHRIVGETGERPQLGPIASGGDRRRVRRSIRRGGPRTAPRRCPAAAARRPHGPRARQRSVTGGSRGEGPDRRARSSRSPACRTARRRPACQSTASDRSAEQLATCADRHSRRRRPGTRRVVQSSARGRRRGHEHGACPAPRGRPRRRRRCRRPRRSAPGSTPRLAGGGQHHAGPGFAAVAAAAPGPWGQTCQVSNGPSSASTRCVDRGDLAPA